MRVNPDRFQRDEEVVLIDQNKLDKECVRLPTDYIRAAHQAAEAKLDIAEAEAELDVVRADVASQVRDTPGKFGLDPQSFRGGTITEAAIKEVVANNKAVKEAEKKVRNAQHDADTAQALVAALAMKKTALSNLVELHGMGYFSEVRASNHGMDAVKRQAARPIRREDR